MGKDPIFHETKQMDTESSARNSRLRSRKASAQCSLACWAARAAPRPVSGETSTVQIPRAGRHRCMERVLPSDHSTLEPMRCDPLERVLTNIKRCLINL